MKYRIHLEEERHPEERNHRSDHKMRWAANLSDAYPVFPTVYGATEEEAWKKMRAALLKNILEAKDDSGVTWRDMEITEFDVFCFEKEGVTRG